MSFGVCGDIVLVMWLAWMANTERGWSSQTRHWLVENNADVYRYLYESSVEGAWPTNASIAEVCDNPSEVELESACIQAERVWFLQWSIPFGMFVCHCLASVFAFASYRFALRKELAAEELRLRALQDAAHAAARSGVEQQTQSLELKRQAKNMEEQKLARERLEVLPKAMAGRPSFSADIDVINIDIRAPESEPSSLSQIASAVENEIPNETDGGQVNVPPSGSVPAMIPGSQQDLLCRVDVLGADGEVNDADFRRPEDVAACVAAAKQDELWQIIHKGGCNVRQTKATSSAVLGVKSRDVMFRALLQGDWLKLIGEPGFILLRRNGKDFCQQIVIEEYQRQHQADGAELLRTTERHLLAEQRETARLRGMLKQKGARTRDLDDASLAGPERCWSSPTLSIPESHDASVPKPSNDDPVEFPDSPASAPSQAPGALFLDGGPDDERPSRREGGAQHEDSSKVEYAATQHHFYMGDRVVVRDRDAEGWLKAIVVSVAPLKAKPYFWDHGHAWDTMEPLPNDTSAGEAPVPQLVEEEPVPTVGEAERSEEEDLLRVIEVAALSVVMAIAVMYCALYVSGSAASLGSAFLCLAMGATAVVLGWVYLEVDHQLLKDYAESNPFAKSGVKILQSDWMRAILVGGLNVFIPAAYMLDMVRQRLRECFGEAKPPLDPSDRSSRFRLTEEGSRLMMGLRAWNWSSILTKVCILGELFVALVVGAKMTFVLLSWANTELAASGLDFGLVAVLAFVVGLMMFLCPIVPGTAVYLFSGVVLGHLGQQANGPGFVWGYIVAVIISAIAKHIACCGQYLIGFAAGRSVKVQQFVGVDKVETRALEKVLNARGFALGKVCVLVAGPDFPTSVMCGILKLSVPQMLIATTPVILVSIVPQCLVGALLTKEHGDNGVSGMISTAAQSLAAIAQASAWLAFSYYIMQTIQTDRTLGDFREEHRAVAELTKREEAYVRKYQEVSDWERMSSGRNDKRALILSAMVLMLLSGFMVATDFMLTEKFIFRKFSITDRIDDWTPPDGLRNNAFNLVMLPMGPICLCLVFIAAVLHVAYGKLLSSAARAELERTGADAVASPAEPSPQRAAADGEDEVELKTATLLTPTRTDADAVASERSPQRAAADGEEEMWI
jgi:uncharacterized membrane protein YdjX (TVP38/TMEM64 family)